MTDQMSRASTDLTFSTFRVDEFKPREIRPNTFDWFPGMRMFPYLLRPHSYDFDITVAMKSKLKEGQYRLTLVDAPNNASVTFAAYILACEESPINDDMGMKLKGFTVVLPPSSAASV